MRGSKLYLGADAAYEARFRDNSGCDLYTLHRLSQRIAWGVLMGERLGLDLDAEVASVLRRCGDHFAAHMAAAYARRKQLRHTEADAHLARARQLVSADHPWAAIVPDDASWREVLEPQLEQDEPGRVYSVLADGGAPGTGIGNRGVARFLRMRSGELVYLNPVALPDALVEQVRALGEVTHVIAPSKFHSEHVPLALAQFPTARAFGVPGHRGYANVAHIPFAGYLDDDAPLFPDELEQITVRGVEVGDVLFIDRATRTLIVTDSIFVTRAGAPNGARFRSAFGAFYAWAWGVHDRIGVPTYQPAMWSDIAAYQASLRRAFGHDFEHVASCHGSWRSIDGNAKATLTRELAWLLELGKLDALALLGDFVRRQPRSFYRLLKEKLAERSA